MSKYLYLAHHGVKGQKHGRRQYQNPDGSLTALGRIHYGVGAARNAAGKIGTAIRKRVKPTNAELNAKIRKEKSKILNKQKRAELKRLKKTGKIEDPAKKSPHKRYKDLTDADIKDKIDRLKKEAELAELETLQNMSPMRRQLVTSLHKGLQTGVQVATQDAIKSVGKRVMGDLLGSDNGGDNNSGGSKKNASSSKKNASSSNNNASSSNNNASSSNNASYRSKRGIRERIADANLARSSKRLVKETEKTNTEYRINTKREMTRRQKDALKDQKRQTKTLRGLSLESEKKKYHFGKTRNW